MILPLRELELFPGMVAALAIRRKRSIAVAQEAARERRPIGVLMQRSAQFEEPTAAHLHHIMTSAHSPKSC